MTFLRWAGSKKQLVHLLSSCWYASRCSGAKGRYIEAFSGSAVLFFSLKPSRAILVDVNPHLQECMRVVRRMPREVASLLASFSGSEEEYYRVRSLNEDLLSPVERAARFIFLNRYCFNGLYRTNSNGRFNVPFGKSNKSGELPGEKILIDASRTLSRARIIEGDFFDALVDEVKSGDFVYLDPPYAKENDRIRHQYGPNVFGIEDLYRLKKLLNKINAVGAHFVMSYAKCDEVAEIGDKWVTFQVNVQRTIAAKPESRKIATELLISNL